MKYFILNLIFISVLNAQQITISELSVLNNQIKETSGLIYYNNKVVTINDSGNPPYLYEIDTVTGDITRTIIVDNATNIDWESLAQDSLYIYIADFGNNSGDRADLKIYRISKSNYLLNNNVNADTISFTYNNQTDFTSNYRNTRFDAEALSVFNDSLIIFMKDWVNNYTRTYVLPKIPGTYTAYQRNEYNCNGLITGSSFNKNDTSFMLCGYTENLAPFIVYLNDFSDTNVFFGNIQQIDLTDSIGTSQVEGICLKENNKYFLSREEFIYQNINLEPKLYEINYLENSTNIEILDKVKITLLPNPANNFIHINTKENMFKNIVITDVSGVIIKQFKNVNTKLKINISDMQNGLYFVILKTNNISQTIKFIKK